MVSLSKNVIISDTSSGGSELKRVIYLAHILTSLCNQGERGASGLDGRPGLDGKPGVAGPPGQRVLELQTQQTCCMLNIFQCRTCLALIRFCLLLAVYKLQGDPGKSGDPGRDVSSPLLKAHVVVYTNGRKLF